MIEKIHIRQLYDIQTLHILPAAKLSIHQKCGPCMTQHFECMEDFSPHFQYIIVSNEGKILCMRNSIK